MASIAKKRHFSEVQLYEVVHQKLKGKSIMLNSGKQRHLDECRQRLRCEEIQYVTCISIGRLKQSVDTEFKATSARRYSIKIGDDEAELEMSRRSFKRYVTLLHPGLFPPPSPDEQNMP